MNKKILGVFVGLLAVAMLATPVIAKPTQGQKVAVTLTFTGQVSEPIEVRDTGVVEHRHGHVNWTLILAIQDGPTYMGEAIDTERYVLTVPQENGNKIVFREIYEMWFPSAGGGFVGMASIMMDGVGNPPVVGKAHALLHGTGAFEGQTLNVGHHRALFSPPIQWDGYLLKP
jgi:hypothetical protein